MPESQDDQKSDGERTASVADSIKHVRFEKEKSEDLPEISKENDGLRYEDIRESIGLSSADIDHDLIAVESGNTEQDLAELAEYAELYEDLEDLDEGDFEDIGDLKEKLDAYFSLGVN